MEHIKKSRLLLTSFIVCALIALNAPRATSANVPTIEQVYEVARSGNLSQAEAMMHEVLRAYPRSARAHFVMAQILAKEGRIAEARSHFEEAERLKPGLPFASPRSVAELERKLATGGDLPVRSASQGASSRIYWLWIILAVVLIWVIYRILMANRSQTVVYRSGGFGPGAGAGTVGGSPMPYGGGGGTVSGGGGGGFWHSILAGLGFGAGVAAGEYAVDRILGGEGRSAEAAPPPAAEPPSSAGDDLGGEDFGVRPGDEESGGWEDSGDSPSASSGWDDDDFGTGGSDDSGGWDDSSGGDGDIDV